MGTHELSERARKAETPLRGQAIRGTRGAAVPVKPDQPENARRQRKAVKKLSECEALTGLTVEQIDALHAEQRARVRARYGVAS